jgi:hypothetical protein
MCAKCVHPPPAPRGRDQRVILQDVAGRKRILDLGDGQPREVEEVGFRSSGEHWNEYLLDDGTVIRIKLVATEVLKVVGQFDAEGNPAYFVKSTNVTNVSAPADLRRDEPHE